jgi:chromosome segregation ATPase
MAKVSEKKNYEFANVLENEVKQLLDLTEEIDDVTKSLRYNEARINALTDREKMYRSIMDEPNEKHGLCAYRMISLREKLLSTDENKKKRLTKQLEKLENEDESFTSWYARIDNALNEIDNELKTLRSENFELDTELPRLVESRNTIFSRLLNSDNVNLNNKVESSNVNK